jgi:eukaryotic-like serine/threonine-protein kinase
VMDFGIARAVEDVSSCEGEAAAAAQTSRGGESQTGLRHVDMIDCLTEVGTLVGTPAYMAPEQHRGERADEKSDQYAYCVALHEMLFGERPFSGSSPAQLAIAKERGEPRYPAGVASVPRWVRRIVLRGLSPDPDARWPSIEALVDALGADPRRRWTRGIGACAGVAGLGAVAVAVAAPRENPCTRAAEQLDGIWDTHASTAVESALVATGVSHAGQTATRVRRRLDAFAAQWAASHTQACLAHRRGEQSQVLLDARMSCLHGRRRQLAALVETLASADGSVVHKAVDAIAALPSIDRCDDPDYVQAQVPPPDDPRVEKRVEALRERLAEAWALQSAGKYGDGLRIADAMVAEVEAIDYPPLLAELAYRRGWLLEGTGVYEDALQSLSEAFFTSRRSGMDELAAQAASVTVFVLARLARHDEAFAWAEHARVEVERFGSDAMKAYLLGVVAIVHDEQGSYEEATKLHEEALALRMTALGPEHHAVAQSLNNLARTQYGQGALEDARANFERALEIWEAALGPEHPSVAEALNNIAAIWLEQGEKELAMPLYERALAIWEGAHGPEHPSVATALNNLALIERLRGRWEQAEQLHQRALVIHEETLGSHHPLVATSLKNLASVKQERGAFAEARELHERALAIREQALGPDHPHVASALCSLGELHHELGALEEAQQLFARALSIRERAFDTDHPDTAAVLTGLAEVVLERGRVGESTQLLERALTIRMQDGIPDTDLAETQSALARALWARGDRDRAIELARAARGVFRDAGEGWASSRAQVEAWLAEHAPRR